MDQISSDRFKTAILLLAVAGLLSGLAFYFAGNGDIANLVWSAAVIPALAALVVEILRSIGRGDLEAPVMVARAGLHGDHGRRMSGKERQHLIPRQLLGPVTAKVCELAIGEEPSWINGLALRTPRSLGSRSRFSDRAWRAGG